MAKKSSASSRQGLRHKVKNGDITLTTKMKNELKALKNRKAIRINKDTPAISDWSEAVVGKFYRPVKKQITIRVDADVLDWFKHHTQKYQTLINLACRDYMQRHRGNI